MNDANTLGDPERAIRLYGTDEAVAPLQILQAGDLSAELDGGNLRHIRLGGVELIRAISFVVRDRNWGTYNPVISNLHVETSKDHFRVSYDALAKDDEQSFEYKANISGFSDGRVNFEASGTAKTNFTTNRTGFVVLHPANVAGSPVSIQHADGSGVIGRFPELIDPVQPMMNLRSLTHDAASGLSVTCHMIGDVFEMEDQRNWADASYKTYVRPLALPWPYTLEQNESVEQTVRLTVNGKMPASGKADEAVMLKVGEPLGRNAPRFGIGLDPIDSLKTLDKIDILKSLGAHIGVCHYDPQRAHNQESLTVQLQIAKALHLEPWLEAVVVSVDNYAQELSELGAIVDQLERPFRRVLVSPAPDLKCTLPGSPWPPAPPPEDFFKAARKAFPEAELGGGMFSLFTEMNRKRPPIQLLDLVSFTTTATMHAGDDHSVMEGLEALDAIAKSARAIAEHAPYAVGPSAIGMRMNPYGEAPMANPRNVRQAMNFNDPRQRGLLGAAWAVGFYSRFAEGAANVISLGGLTGAFGVVHTPEQWPQPWFDQNKGGLFPVFHALRGLSRLAGRPMCRVGVSAPQYIAAIAVRDIGATEIWAANLTPVSRTISTENVARSVSILSEENFVEASRDVALMDHASFQPDSAKIELAPYGIAQLVFPSL